MSTVPHDHKGEDYLQTAEATVPSFHFRTGKIPWLPIQIAPRDPATQWGYPQPGPQSPTPAFATAKHYFVDDTTWGRIVDHGEFDDIVIGSGFCALAYIERAYKKDPFRKILLLERGGFWLSEHFQNMPLPFKLVLGGPSETFPWQLTQKTVDTPNKFMHGSCPFFGGRSTFWSAWCPRPLRPADGIDLMRDFPQSLKDKAKKEQFWKDAEDMLRVKRANQISDPCFGKDLQKFIQHRLTDAVAKKEIPNANLTNDAPLAVGRKTAVENQTVFDKFSTPGPLLEVYESQRRAAAQEPKKGHPLMIATDTIVERFELVNPESDSDNLTKTRGSPNVLHTSRGTLCFPHANTNIILAAGAFPATTILMNSIPDRLKGRAGSRVSGHYISHIAARFPISLMDNAKFSKHLEIGASYLAGTDPTTGLQFHVQITAIHSPHPKADAPDAARLCPDYAAAPTEEQLVGSENYIVLVCATLGELDEKNPDSWVKHHKANPDVTTNIRLQVLPNDKTKSCTKVMEDATYKAIEIMARGEADKVEYWHDKQMEPLDGFGPLKQGNILIRPAGWRKERAPADMIRVPGLVHETSTLYMSDDLDKDQQASVDKEYRPHLCDNVYVTGGAIFPTSGSWNPTLTMCGFAQDLADKLYEKKQKQCEQAGKQ